MKRIVLGARASCPHASALIVALVTATLALTVPFHSARASEGEDVFDRVKHGYADSSGVRIHYATLGPESAPLIVMIHGFPDFWYSWRHQMAVLSKDYQVAAIDQRGYNLSDKPKGKENYDMSLLVDDVRAVIKHLGRDRAIIVGHDWGGRVAWGFAMKYPEMTHRLIVCNLPHPRGIAYERAHNNEQKINTAYAQRFRQEDAAKNLTAEGLASRVKDPKERAHYVEAFRRSDFEHNSGGESEAAGAFDPRAGGQGADARRAESHVGVA